MRKKKRKNHGGIKMRSIYMEIFEKKIWNEIESKEMTGAAERSGMARFL